MEWRCRQEIEDALWSAARELLPVSALDRKRLLRAITERTALYTTQRDELQDVAGLVQPASDLAARSLFFTVADAAKIAIPLSELASRSLLPKGERWRVLDLGAGAGAMGLGVLSFAADHHPGIALDIDAVDVDEAALQIYSAALQRLPHQSLELGTSSITCRGASTAQLEVAESSYDLVLLGSMLNELPAADATKLAKRAMTALRPGGAVIIIEPALRETSRRLHEIRDALLASGTHIFAPCTRTQAPCPALLDERDWCHEDRPGVLPNRARQLAQSTGLRDGGLKFSYLVARHEPDALVEATDTGEALRVVSQPQRSKGQRSCFACGQKGRLRVRLLKRNRSDRNRLFERAHRGDVVITDNEAWPDDEICDIAKTQELVLLRPANDED